MKETEKNEKKKSRKRGTKFMKGRMTKEEGKLKEGNGKKEV